MRFSLELYAELRSFVGKHRLRYAVHEEPVDCEGFRYLERVCPYYRNGSNKLGEEVEDYHKSRLDTPGGM